MRLEPSPHVKGSAESRGFSPGTPVSSHRESWLGGLGKKGPTVIGICCYGDPALVGKAKINKFKTLNQEHFGRVECN
jgi:hypothetical protein